MRPARQPPAGLSQRPTPHRIRTLLSPRRRRSNFHTAPLTPSAISASDRRTISADSNGAIPGTTFSSNRFATNDDNRPTRDGRP